MISRMFGCAVVAIALTTVNVGAVDWRMTREFREHLGKAAGYMSVCPFVRPTNVMLDMVEEMRREDALKLGDTGFEEAQRTVIEGALLLARHRYICDEAIGEFGPNGSRISGWLIRDDEVLPWPVERLIARSNNEDPSDPVRENVRVIAGVTLAIQQCARIEMGAPFIKFLQENSISLDDGMRGILSGPYFTELLQIKQWQARNPERLEDACRIALRNYGPGGRVMAGLVHEK